MELTNPVGAAGNTAQTQDQEKQLEEEFFKFFAESELMDEFLMNEEDDV